MRLGWDLIKTFIKPQGCQQAIYRLTKNIIYSLKINFHCYSNSQGTYAQPHRVFLCDGYIGTVEQFENDQSGAGLNQL